MPLINGEYRDLRGRKGREQYEKLLTDQSQKNKVRQKLKQTLQSSSKKEIYNLLKKSKIVENVDLESLDLRNPEIGMTTFVRCRLKNTILTTSEFGPRLKFIECRIDSIILTNSNSRNEIDSGESLVFQECVISQELVDTDVDSFRQAEIFGYHSSFVPVILHTATSDWRNPCPSDSKSSRIPRSFIEGNNFLGARPLFDVFARTGVSVHSCDLSNLDYRLFQGLFISQCRLPAIFNCSGLETFLEECEIENVSFGSGPFNFHNCAFDEVTFHETKVARFTDCEKINARGSINFCNNRLEYDLSEFLTERSPGFLEGWDVVDLDLTELWQGGGPKIGALPVFNSTFVDCKDLDISLSLFKSNSRDERDWFNQFIGSNGKLVTRNQIYREPAVQKLWGREKLHLADRLYLEQREAARTENLLRQQKHWRDEFESAGLSFDSIVHGSTKQELGYLSLTFSTNIQDGPVFVANQKLVEYCLSDFPGSLDADNLKDSFIQTDEENVTVEHDSEIEYLNELRISHPTLFGLKLGNRSDFFGLFTYADFEITGETFSYLKAKEPTLPSFFGNYAVVMMEVGRNSFLRVCFSDGSEGLVDFMNILNRGSSDSAELIFSVIKVHDVEQFTQQESPKIGPEKVLIKSASVVK